MHKYLTLLLVVVLIGGFSVSCDKTAKSTNKAPIIQSFNPSFGGSTVGPNQVIYMTVVFSDPDITGTPNPSEFTFKWTVRPIEVTDNDFDPNDNFLIDDKVTCYWRTPEVLGFYEMLVEVTDRHGESIIGGFPFEVSENKSPVITNVDVSNPLPQQNEEVTITVTANDPDGNLPLKYEWSLTGGYFTQEADNLVVWVSSEIKVFTITVKVLDSLGAYVEKKITLSVQGNSPPIIDGYSIEKIRPEKGEEVDISITAHDPDGDELNYNWEATGGSFLIINAETATWVAPETTGNYSIKVKVQDGKSGLDEVTIPIEVIESTP